MTIPEEIAYLYSIRSVRETNSSTVALIENNKLLNFEVDLGKMEEVVDFVVETIRGTFPTNAALLEIPVHGRWQHFGKGNTSRLPDLIEKVFRQELGLDDEEVCRKLIDLFVVSVLLDAGAGNEWKFTEPGTGMAISRSEGIAVASLYMFQGGVFAAAAGGGDPYVVQGSRLASLGAEELAAGLQVSQEQNPMSGFDGRLRLLNRLGEVLSSNKELFHSGRPGDLVDYLKARSSGSGSGKAVELEVLWDALMQGLLPVWPTEGRTKIDGYVVGDAWPLQNKAGGIVTFHKLTQWLTYSLFKPLTEYGGFSILHAECMTGLPEYRNGGLFVDLGVLALKPAAHARGLALAAQHDLLPLPAFRPDDDAIVEWRSCTVCLLDMLLPLVNAKMAVAGTKYELTLPQLIEAGSWKSGRLAAAARRPSGGPPIELVADGTVF
ncbi:hypothetical protein PICMEDRAFT_74820 [Pichia membranifaciens NRRL Y-2026]|uniref:Uracil catabolism protein 4 n=1 Tax=Pichia membranifaciens NRRL Y-2026 TaxID=763406 RepID=A0A1E3NDM5_9ASCO|nr:hypothetical protein PICMEDRAFT_74820 [Pichia membranifaciens NRRL Y-2026]ODQ44214.1 hypothetical protein PICMEDRAFT_74820 [Pichia membranifaciens NRRL Y-2026]